MNYFDGYYNTYNDIDMWETVGFCMQDEYNEDAYFRVGFYLCPKLFDIL